MRLEYTYYTRETKTVDREIDAAFVSEFNEFVKEHTTIDIEMTAEDIAACYSRDDSMFDRHTEMEENGDMLYDLLFNDEEFMWKEHNYEYEVVLRDMLMEFIDDIMIEKLDNGEYEVEDQEIDEIEDDLIY